MTTPSPSDAPHAPRPKRLRKRRIYQFKTFWFFVLVLMSITLIGTINAVINVEDNQRYAAKTLSELTNTKINFTHLKFNLFSGDVSGQDLFLHVQTSNLKLSLTEFRLSYNPLYLFIGKFRITQVDAKELWLDTSDYVGDTKKKSIKVPDFLKRIKLKSANLQRFFWSYPNGDFLAVEKVNLDSKFGSSLFTSPLHLVVNDITFFTQKLHAYVERFEMNGFFLFDFSKPHLLNDSKFNIETDLQRVLIAPYRKPKPWLTDRAWDQDLEPILNNYYPDGIPNDRSFVFLNELQFDAEKSKHFFALNSFSLNLNGHQLTGKGNYQLNNEKLKLDIKTAAPLELSKLPLGQSKFRQSFEKFQLRISFNGQYKDIDHNALDVVGEAKLIGNLVHPEAGDADIKLNGKIHNREFSTKDLRITIADGTIQAAGSVNLKDFTTKTTAKATKIDTQTVVRLFSSVNIPSKVDATGTISGKLNNPDISLDIGSENAMYEFLNFGAARGKLTIRNNDLLLDVQSNNSTIGQSSLKMTVNDVFSAFENTLKLTSKFQNISISPLLNAKSLSGSISGTFNLDRVDAKVKAQGDFAAKGFSFFEQPVGDIAFKMNIKEKHLDITPIRIDTIEPKKSLSTNRGLAFDFNDRGYSFKGELLNTLAVSGEFEKSNRNWIHLNIMPSKFDLDLFKSLIPVAIKSSSLTAKIDLDYNIYDPWQSKMNSMVSEFKLETPDGKFALQRASGFDYSGQAFQFRNFDLVAGDGRFTLNGAVGLKSNSDLKIKGKIDFVPLEDFNPFISESENPIEVDVTLKEDLTKPKVYGTITFANDAIRFRRMEVDLEEMNGKVRFDGNRISTDQIRFNYDDAPVKLSGSISTDYEQITSADLSIQGREVLFYPVSGMPLLSDINLKLIGSGSMLLKGTINIVDGQYNRDFTLTNFILKANEEDDDAPQTIAGLPLNTRYQLRIQNTGDLVIQNNIANLELNTDLDLIGTFEHPNLVGQIDFISGQINAFGIDFNNATGFAQFRKGKGLSPDVSITAKKEIQGYNITARIEGMIDNLRLRLDSTPALSHREILSVIFYGATPDFLTNDTRRNFTQTAAISQLASILSNPVEKISGLDVLRVSSRRQSSTDQIQRLAVGKKITDRIDFAFTTDLGINDPERAFELRYQIFDNFYLIAAKDVVRGNRYRFDLNYRFELY